MIDETTAKRMRGPGKFLLLGIITEQGEILLREATAAACPGHREWLDEAREIRSAYGFALLIEDGRTLAIYRASSLNRAEEGFLLPAAVLDELRRMVGAGANVKVYGH